MKIQYLQSECDRATEVVNNFINTEKIVKSENQTLITENIALSTKNDNLVNNNFIKISYLIFKFQLIIYNFRIKELLF